MAAVEVSARQIRTGQHGMPRMFGNYLLLERIGRGGMAEIYLAHAANELGAARQIVVKQMLPEHSSDPLFIQALITEAKLAASLSHHNIVSVLDLGRVGDRLFIAMDYVEGFDLNQLLGKLSRRQIPLPLEFALFVVREVLAALDYAHRALDAEGTLLGIVHRDVSPANVLISLEGEIKLCDFGIARAYAPDHGTRDVADVLFAALAGKAWYMSPEHARGQDVDARADLFAAGVLLWELCAGRRMYKSGDSGWYDPARFAVIPELPNRGFPAFERLEAILRRALAVDPAMRFQSAHEMLKDLDDYALSNQLMASELRFGAFLNQHFGAEFAEQRRVRELAAEASSEGFQDALSTGQLSPIEQRISRLRERTLSKLVLETGPTGGITIRPLVTEEEPLPQSAFAAQLSHLQSLSQRIGLGVAVASSATLLLVVVLAYWLATH
jgi:serine/threonine protein kinase